MEESYHMPNSPPARAFFPRRGERSRTGLFLYGTLLVLSLLLASCAGPSARPESQLQWPPIPAPPQVVFLKQITDYRDAGVSRGFWHRIADAVVGETDHRIGKPYGVFSDEHGRLFIVDTAFGLVHVMDRAGSSYTTIGQIGEPPLFKTPIAVVGDDAGNLYITDSAGAVVYRYNLASATLTPFIETLGRPTGIAFNKRKRLLYVADTVADRVAVFDLNGNLRFAIGSTGSTSGRLNHPTDIFVDNAGLLYVTDPLNFRIQIFSADGAFLRGFGSAGDAGGEFLKPKGLAVDSAGRIFVADALSDSVKVYDPSGAFRFSFGSNGEGDGMFWMPSGLYIDRDDRVYVADTYNRRIQVFRSIVPVKEK